MSSELLSDEPEDTPLYLARFDFNGEQDGRVSGTITWKNGRETRFDDCAIPAGYEEPDLGRERGLDIQPRYVAYSYRKEADPFVSLLVGAGFLLALGALVFLAIMSKV